MAIISIVPEDACDPS